MDSDNSGVECKHKKVREQANRKCLIGENDRKIANKICAR